MPVWARDPVERAAETAFVPTWLASKPPVPPPGTCPFGMPPAGVLADLGARIRSTGFQIVAQVFKS